MFRPASRALLRAPAFAARSPVTRRYIGTARPDEKSRSWKNKAVRLGLAIGAVYFYNTSSVFAEEPSLSLRPKQSRNEVVEESSLTLDSIKPKIREEREKASSASVPKPQDDPARTDSHSPQKTQPQSESPALETGLKTSPEELEEEAGQEAAFNPETGEINWDCPCLGGMAHGPCGEEFKAAFSCFVYSSEEPKGIDCIDKFKGMQDCFRQHPDVYGSELEDDETEVGGEPGNDAPAGSAEDAPSASVSAAERDVSSNPEEKQARAEDVRSEVKATDGHTGEQPESDELLPKAMHDSHDQLSGETEK